jgi:hypothetical protein
MLFPCELLTVLFWGLPEAGWKDKAAASFFTLSEVFSLKMRGEAGPQIFFPILYDMTR